MDYLDSLDFYRYSLLTYGFSILSINSIIIFSN
jgi:hypothetical protein